MVEAGTSRAAPLDAIDRALLDELQAGIAVCERPFAAVAARLGLDETALVERLARMLDTGVLSRFGPMYDAERLGGRFTLCAMAVPEARFDEVAAIVNSFDETAHNYARAHRLNMWFVLAAEQPERIAAVIAEIQRGTGLQVLDLPKEEEFFIGLRLSA